MESARDPSPDVFHLIRQVMFHAVTVTVAVGRASRPPVVLADAFFHYAPYFPYGSVVLDEKVNFAETFSVHEVKPFIGKVDGLTCDVLEVFVEGVFLFHTALFRIVIVCLFP